MPVRKHKRYNRPRKLYDVALMKSENALIKKYGLKSRREVWKADFIIGKIRNIAKTLITASEKDKTEFINRQAAKGFNVSSIADILALSKEDCLKRRLQSIVVAKKITTTYKHARQLITHRHIKILGSKIDSPAHLTTIEEENSIDTDLSIPAKKIISDEEKNLLKTLKHEKSEKKAE